MSFSKKSRYALRALVDLAVNGKEEQQALGMIAQRNGISPQYLEQIFGALRKNGLVRSVKGAQGGYFLARRAEDITVSEILEAVDGSYRIEPEEPEAGAVSEAIQSTVIDRVNSLLTGLLEGITLADLEREYDVCSQAGQKMYYI